MMTKKGVSENWSQENAWLTCQLVHKIFLKMFLRSSKLKIFFNTS